ncbi:MAG TPA: PepSY domain-containing protein [Candidatus Pullilachnospira intestinigallinarum]|nr:PepSY domain-containing protein [Candidatus Pullilachnospira intestinigallinarum]
MKKRFLVLSAVMVMGMAVAGCGGNRSGETVRSRQSVESTGNDEIVAEAPQTTQGSGSNAASQNTEQNSTRQNGDGQDQSGQAQTTGSAGSGATAADNQSSGGQITEEEAKNIALKDAGYTEADVTGIRVKQDRDDGRDIYEVDFYVQAEEFDYDIDRSTGQILSRDYDIDEDFNNQSGQNVSGVISRDEAIQIVLARVEGATEKDVRIKLDYDDGRQIYEGDIFYNQTEYEFELNAQTGDILEWSEER